MMWEVLLVLTGLAAAFFVAWAIDDENARCGPASRRLRSKTERWKAIAIIMFHIIVISAVLLHIVEHLEAAGGK